MGNVSIIVLNCYVVVCDVDMLSVICLSSVVFVIVVFLSCLLNVFKLIS